MTLNPRERGDLVEALHSAVFHGGAALSDVPALLRRVLQEGAWRDFETPMHGRIHYDRFEEFVRTPPTRGLGADIALIRRIVSNDLPTLSALDTALDVKPGHPIHDNIMNSEQGTSVEYALRRLRKDRPDLHAQVLAGEKSPHAAMVEAGFRRDRRAVPLDNMADLARTLRRRLDAAEIEELVRLLCEVNDEQV